MSIEFTCPSCNQLLTTPDDTAGKKGKCPHCESVMHVPKVSAANHWPPGMAHPGARRAAAFELSAPHAAASESSSSMQVGPQSAPSPAAADGERIAFRCQSCNRLLRTPAHTAGRQGQCPNCGMLMDIPLESTVAPHDSALAALGPGTGPENLPVLVPRRSIHDPLVSSGKTLQIMPAEHLSVLAAGRDLGKVVTRDAVWEAAKMKIVGPAFGLIAYAAGGALLNVSSLFSTIAQGVEAPQQFANVAAFQTTVIVAAAVFVLLALAIYGLIVYGAICMLKLKGRTMAQTACYLSLLPCSFSCIIGVPCAVWGLIVLNDEVVKRAFR